MDSEGKPIGAPERDIANFQQRIGSWSRQANIHPDEIQTVLERFQNVYEQCSEVTLSETKLRMFEARYVLGDIIWISKTGISSPNSFFNLQVEIAALKRILKFDRFDHSCSFSEDLD